MLLSFIGVLLLGGLFFFPSGLLAQSVNPYLRLTDPLAIADLSQQGISRAHHYSFVGGGYGLEPDGYRILIELDGPGVISHIWATHPDAHFDTSAYIKLYLDDSMLYDGRLADFFLKPAGIFKGPLIRHESGGLVSDLQMNYLRGFKLTFRGDYTFFAISWRDHLSSNGHVSFIASDSSLAAQRLAAEENYLNVAIKHEHANEVKIERELTLQPGGTEIFSDDTAGVITSLKLVPNAFDADLYRNLWLRCYWDGDPTPAIDVPIADLFGAGYGLQEINSFAIKTGEEQGLQCLLPMPYKRGARVVIMNKNQVAVSTKLDLRVSQSHDREFGRLHAQFNETPVPRVRHLLPVLHAKGRGRAIGVIFNMQPTADPFYLEGDPILVVDSSSAFTMRYPGTEDYFNGGWYFRDGAFSAPFAGCPSRWSSLYRFHYLDAIDFSQSIDWQWQHGANSDLFEHYRTVSLYYLEPQYVWVSQDSIVAGMPLAIGGTGFLSGSLINVEIAGIPQEHAADVAGNFNYTIKGNALPVGEHLLKVNGRTLTRPVTILAAPVIEWVRDSQYAEFSPLDSVEVILRGFEPASLVSIYLDAVHHLTELQLDHEGTGRGFVQLGHIDSGVHQLSAYNETRSLAGHTSFRSTRTLRYEIEDLQVVSTDVTPRPSYMGWWPTERWSNMKILFATPESKGQGVTVAFETPYTGEYDIELSTTRGLRYATMGVSIDGMTLGTIDCFYDTLFAAPLHFGRVKLGTRYLERGTHLLQFSAEGKHELAPEFAIGPDALYLTPLSEPNSAPSKAIHDVIGVAVTYLMDGSPVFHILNEEDELLEGVLSLSDILGSPVKELFRGRTRGPLRSRFTTEDLAPGIYYLTLATSSGGRYNCSVLIH